MVHPQPKYHVYVFICVLCQWVYCYLLQICGEPTHLNLNKNGSLATRSCQNIMFISLFVFVLVSVFGSVFVSVLLRKCMYCWPTSRQSRWLDLSQIGFSFNFSFNSMHSNRSLQSFSRSCRNWQQRCLQKKHSNLYTADHKI